MKNIFPPMTSKPEKIKIFSLMVCWIFVFVLIPMYMPFLGLGLWEQSEISVWLEIGYHVVNGVAMLLLMSSYLKEEWFMVTTDVGYYLKHVALTAGLILGAELVLLGSLYLGGLYVPNLLESLPVTEMSVSHTPLFVVILQPVLGTIVLSVFSPVSICALFYCSGFAPVCYRKPWAAYLYVAAITLIPPIIDILWRGETGFTMSGYLVQLPIHLLACWSYQKTDNVWTPIASLAVTNLLLSIVLPLLVPLLLNR